MGLSEQQVRTLVQLTVTTTPESVNGTDCDGCFGQIAEFAEMHLANQTICESMRRVDEHLKNCPCCKDEFEALKAALVSLADDR